MRFVHPLGAPVDGVDVLGARGADLARLVSFDLPVAQGFVVSTACWYLARLPHAPAAATAVRAQTEAELGALELLTGRRLDDPADPLLISVTPSSTSPKRRDEAAIVDVGLSDVTVAGLAARTDDGFAWRAYRELLCVICTRVHELDHASVSAAIAHAGADPQRQVRALKSVLSSAGHPWPEHSRDQLAEIVAALLDAAPEPTAVVVQARAFGVAARLSGFGKLFTRDPVRGTTVAFGEFRPGSDRFDRAERRSRVTGIDQLTRHIPQAAADLRRDLASIEVIHQDMCEVDFTVEAGQLVLHDARPGPRSSQAAVQIAVDLVDAGLIDVETALYRIPLSALEDLQRPVVSHDQQLPVLACGAVASPGVAIGTLAYLPDCEGAGPVDLSDRVVVCADAADLHWSFGGAAGLVLSERSPTSAAAALARRLRCPAICAVGDLSIAPGTEVTLDAHAGTLYAGRALLSDPTPGVALGRMLGWAADGARLPGLRTPPTTAAVVDLPSDLGRALGIMDLARKARPELALWLALPNQIRGDLRPPPGRWAGVVGPPHLRWAADVLAWRLTQAKLPALPLSPAAAPGS